MREFFRGWRRKVGCLTLVMASVATCLLLRAQIQSDAIYFNEARANILSKRSSLIFVWSPSGNNDGTAVDWRSWKGKGTDPFEGRESGWRMEIAGIQVGTYSVDDPVTIVVIPDMWVIIPLTLLSAYLILWKPRKRVNQDA